MLAAAGRAEGTRATVEALGCLDGFAAAVGGVAPPKKLLRDVWCCRFGFGAATAATAALAGGGFAAASSSRLRFCRRSVRQQLQAMG